MKTVIRKRCFAAVMGLATMLATSGCLYTAILGTASTPMSSTANSHPADDILIQMVKAIEERRPEHFANLLDPASVPPKDQLWQQLTTFLNRADAVEYNITVEKREVEQTSVIYIFAWQRKFEDKTTGQTITTPGRSEWHFQENLGTYTLLSMSGSPLF